MRTALIDLWLWAGSILPVQRSVRVPGREIDTPAKRASPPPTDCRGLIDAIRRARHAPASCSLCGSNSLDLIFRALRHWRTQASRVLLLDSTYGKYAHVVGRRPVIRLVREGLQSGDCAWALANSVP
jgi:hypothetical protein